MDALPDSTRTPEPGPSPARRPWVVPAIEDLGTMKDLTLQDSIGCEVTPENPICF